LDANDSRKNSRRRGLVIVEFETEFELSRVNNPAFGRYCSVSRNLHSPEPWGQTITFSGPIQFQVTDSGIEEAELEVSSDSDKEYLGVAEDVPAPSLRPPERDEISSLAEGSGDHPTVIKHNEVVDDYVRNFFKRMGMQDTLATFQRE
jgi:hypothetical protein